MSVVAPSIPHPTLSSAPARRWWSSAAARSSAIAALAIAGILTHVALRWGSDVSPAAKALPLYVVLVAGGAPLVLSLALKLFRREFGSDLLAGISIVGAVLLQEYPEPASMPRSPRSRTSPDVAFWSSSRVQTRRSQTLPRSSK